MKIRLALLENNTDYLERIVSSFTTKYEDKFEIYSFTDQKAAMKVLDSAKIDVFIASDVFHTNISDIPMRCAFASFVDIPSAEGAGSGQKTICRFQKSEQIYKQILNLYSEKAGALFEAKGSGGDAQLLLFNSVSGGTGASSVAAACAMHFTAQRKRVLYLNLEKFGSSEVFFKGEGQFNMSDVIYAIKSKKGSLSLKLESCVRQSSAGVFFFAPVQTALDMFELNSEESMLLISELSRMGAYDVIIIDMDFVLDKELLRIYRQVHSVIWVGDGSEVSNSKIERAYRALIMLDQNADLPLTEKICLMYNKFSNKTGKILTGIELRSLGGVPRFEHASAMQVLTQLSSMEILDKMNQMAEILRQPGER